MQHALLAPSSADVWSKCPGSVVLNSMVPDSSNPEAAEGTAAHWVAQQILEDAIENGAASTASFEHLLGNADPDGTLITKEMIEGAKLYADHIHSLGIDFPNYNVEDHVEIPRIHPTECSGTPDFWGMDQYTLHIVDFKFGFGNVEIFENKQLICYYCGIVDLLNLQDTNIKVVFHIVQPRCFSGDGPIKKWEVNAEDLRGLINILSKAAHDALGSDTVTISGNQCRYCPARHSCESSRQAAVAAIEYQNEATPHPLTDEALAYELPALINAQKALEYRLDSLTDEAIARMGAGKNIPNVSMKQTYGHRAWTLDTETVQNLAEMSGTSFIKEPELVTPAEAERRLKKTGLTAKESSEMLNGLAEKPARGMKISIITSDDVRKAFSK